MPGVLADLFEVVAGAIYKDSGYSRKAVVKSFTPFLYQAYGNKLKFYSLSSFSSIIWDWCTTNQMQKQTVNKICFLF
jgi:dsRNA-specific ribonuclease